MSAFIVSHKHINYMVNALAAYQVNIHWDGITYDPRYQEDAAVLAAVLLKENVRSVCARYTQDKPEDYTDYVIAYRYSLLPYTKIEPVQVVKACQCYDYQACETNDWKQTFAYRICSWLESTAISKLPGYDAAQWEIN